MKLSDLVYRIGELRKPTGDRLISDVKDFINLGQRMICERCNFSFMRSHEDVILASGNVSAPLPDNFKQLTAEQSPVTFTDATITGGFPVPIPVYSREQMQNRGWWPLIQWNMGTTAFFPNYGVFIDIDQGNPTINIPQNVQAADDLHFTVSGYFYPADLVKGSDHNGLTDHGTLSDALVNIARALAYESEDPTDPRGLASRAKYEAAITTSLYTDFSKDNGGRRFSM